MKENKQGMFDFYKKNSKRLTPFIILIGLMLFLLFGLPNEIRYTKSAISGWFFPMIILVMFLLLRKFLQAFDWSNVMKNLILYSSIFLIVGIFYFGHGVISKLDIEKNGAKTKGVIIKKVFSKRRKNKKGDWMITCQFLVDDKKYITYKAKDKQNIYTVGDSLMILYSSKNPRNNKIIIPKGE